MIGYEGKKLMQKEKTQLTEARMHSIGSTIHKDILSRRIYLKIMNSYNLISQSFWNLVLDFLK